MNCRTDNCPNPVPRLDELCEACRAMEERIRNGAHAMLPGDHVVVEGRPIIFDFDTTKCHQPGLCGISGAPYIAPGSDQVIANIRNDDGTSYRVWFCSKACYGRKRAPSITAADILAAGIEPGQPVRLGISCDGGGNVTRAIETIPLTERPKMTPHAFLPCPDGCCCAHEEDGERCYSGEDDDERHVPRKTAGA